MPRGKVIPRRQPQTKLVPARLTRVSSHSSRSLGTRVSIFYVLVFMNWCTNARGDERPTLTHLSWNVPLASGCIPARELEKSVETSMGRKVFADRASASHELVGVIEQRQGEWIAVLQLMGDTENTRELRSSGQCSGLNRPLAVVMAMLLETWQENGATAPPIPTLALGLMLDAHSGTLPRVAFGARVVALLTAAKNWPTLRAHVGASLPERAMHAGVGARFRAFEAGLSACPMLAAGGNVNFALCAGVVFTALQAQALGLSSPHAPVRMVVSLPLEAAVTVQLFPRAAMRIELGPTFAALRPAFYFDDPDKNLHVVHRVAFWGASARLGFIADVL